MKWNNETAALEFEPSAGRPLTVPVSSTEKPFVHHMVDTFRLRIDAADAEDDLQVALVEPTDVEGLKDAVKRATSVMRRYQKAFDKLMEEAITHSYELENKRDIELHNVGAALSNMIKEARVANAVLRQELAAAQRTTKPHEEHPINCPEVRERVWKLTDGKCAYCGCDTVRGEALSGLSFCVEHVVPKALGGPDNVANYVPACMSCNTKKHANHVLQFIQAVLLANMKSGARRS